MASIEKRVRDGLTRYVVRYRDPSGIRKVKTFVRKVDAERWLTGVEHSKITGTYMDPGRSKITVGAWAQQWMASQSHLKPSTAARYGGILSKHIQPRWGTTPLAAVDHAAAQKWISGLGVAPATVRYIPRVFSLIMELAVRDGRIAKNPADGVRLHRAAKPERRFLSHELVHQLADAAAQYPIPQFGEQNRALILRPALG